MVFFGVKGMEMPILGVMLLESILLFIAVAPYIERSLIEMMS